MTALDPEELQKAYADMMDKAMRDAVENLEQVRAMLEAEREAVAKEMDDARTAHQSAIQQGERIAAEHFTQYASEWKERTREQLLRQLIISHLRAGKSIAEICAWMDIDEPQVTELAKQYGLSSLAAFGGDLHDTSPRLLYFSSGRGGTVRFENTQTSFDMWWEFAGGGALAIVNIPAKAQWEILTGTSIADRDAILRFIGMQIVFDQTGGRGSFIYDDQFLTIYS